MLNTYEEINRKLEEFTNLITDSALIEYNCDDFTRFSANDHSYPMLWVTPLNMNVVDGQITFIMQLNFMDIVGEKTDMMKTLSDVAITVGECLAYLDDDSDNNNYYASLTAPFTPFFRQIDNVTGWQGQVSFNLAYPANTELIRWKN